MKDYDGRLYRAKDYTLKTLSRLAAKQADPHEMAGAVDELNRAWDELTEALVRQRRERDQLIQELLNQLAERKPL